MTIVRLDPGFHRALWDHLLPIVDRREQGAFLFAAAAAVDGRLEFSVIDHAFLGPQDFATQSEDHLELADTTRIRLIKQAHRLDATLIELHSHPGPSPGGFSPSDRFGLQETVPHMWWRLKGRPYLAIVVAPSGFDALVWLSNPHVPEALTGIQVGDNLLAPTN